MREQFSPNQNSSDKNELLKDGQDLMCEKKEKLERSKEQSEGRFEFSEKEKATVKDAIEIRREIRMGIASHEYLAEIDRQTKNKISDLALKINGIDLGDQEHIFIEDENGNKFVQYEDGTMKALGETDIELIDSLDKYFDSFREVHNASRFRSNVKNASEQITQEAEKRKITFYSKNDKNDELAERIHAKYEKAGFSRDEIGKLLEFSQLKNINDLEVYDIKMFSKIKEVFSKFVGGEINKYVGLSTALMVPAFLDGYAPSLLADAFKHGKFEKEEITQIVLYGLMAFTSTAGSVAINKRFKDFTNENYSKDDGFAEHASKNLAEFPGNEIKEFGNSKINQVISKAKGGYDNVIKTIGTTVLPAAVTVITSAVMLYEKSPMLAAGTAGGTGLMFFIDKMVRDKGKFHQKERRADNENVEMVKKIEQLINAHMEVILAGEKDEFAIEMQELLSREKISASEMDFLESLQYKVQESYSAVNMIISSLVCYFAGGSPDKFIAALMYSGNFKGGIETIMRSYNKLLRSVKKMIQMEIMFNGYAEEEKEKEQYRIGMSEIQNTDISLEGINLSYGKRKILDDINLRIPQGSFVSLEAETGGGKTTLMKIISGYYKPDEGSVSLGETDVDSIKKSGKDSLFTKITYLPQYPYILDDTIRKNLTFGVLGDVDDEEIKGILKEVGLQKRFTDLNEKMSSGRGDMGSSSGGETSRIGLARAILKLRKNKSRIVFLDEPTASVDDKTAGELAKIINLEKQQNPDATFISISHSKDFRKALQTTMTVVLEDGKLTSI